MTPQKRRSRAPVEALPRSSTLRHPRPVPLVAEQDQLFPGVPVEDLPSLWAEPGAPVPDYSLAQEALTVLLTGGPARLALEGEFVGYRARFLRAQLLTSQLPGDPQQLAGGVVAQILVPNVHHPLAAVPAAHEVGPREAGGVGSGEGVLDKRGQVLVDVVVVFERELPARARYLSLVPLVRDQLLMVPGDHDIPPIPPGGDGVLYPPGAQVVPVHDRGPENREAVPRERHTQSASQHLADPGAAGFGELVDHVERHHAGEQVHHTGPDELVLPVVDSGVKVHRSYSSVSPSRPNNASVPTLAGYDGSRAVRRVKAGVGTGDLHRIAGLGEEYVLPRAVRRDP